MFGFHPGTARKAPTAARGARQHKADGGLIRGPGTGTSDSIEDTVPAGSYIMPADSTKQIGEAGLGAMGARGFGPASAREGVDVRLSNGEYRLPPEQVHAVGVQALDAMKDATHMPVSEGLGFTPEDAMYFADGGVVTRKGNAYSGGSVTGPVSINGAAPGGTVSTIDGAAPAPAASAAPAATHAVRFVGGFSGRPAPEAPAAAGPGLGFRPRGYANGGLVDEEARRRANSFGDAAAAARDSSVTQLGAPRPAAASAGSSDLGASIPAPLPMLTPSLPPSPQAQQLAGFGAPSAGAGRGAINPPPARPAAGAVAAANDASLRFSGYPLTDEQQSRVVARFDQDARDRAAGAEAERQGVPPVFGISAPAPAPAAATAPTSAPATPAAVAPPAAAAPVQEPAAPLADSGVAAPGGFGPTARSGPAAGSLGDADAQAANLRAFNASVPVGGLTVINNPGPAAAQSMFDQADLRTAAARGAWSPRRGFQSDQGAIAAAAVPVQNRQQAELEAGRQAADTQRAGLGFQSAAQREAAAARLQSERIAAEDRRAADTNSIRREEVAGANRLRDTQVAAAQDEAALRRIVLDPKTSVSERGRAQQGLLAMQGKVAGGEWKPVALQGSTDASGNKTEGVLAAVNSATGEVRRLDQGQGAGGPATITNDAAGRQRLASLPAGAEFIGPDGKRYRKD